MKNEKQEKQGKQEKQEIKSEQRNNGWQHKKR